MYRRGCIFFVFCVYVFSSANILITPSLLQMKLNVVFVHVENVCCFIPLRFMSAWRRKKKSRWSYNYKVPPVCLFCTPSNVSWIFEISGSRGEAGRDKGRQRRWRGWADVVRRPAVRSLSGSWAAHWLENNGLWEDEQECLWANSYRARLSSRCWFYIRFLFPFGMTVTAAAHLLFLLRGETSVLPVWKHLLARWANINHRSSDCR